MSPKWMTPVVKQSWLAFSILICIIGQGMAMGYMSSLLQALRAKDSPIKLDLASESWLASSFGPAVLFGICAASIIMDCNGRRIAYLVSTLPGIFGWVFMYFASNYNMLMLGRILTGVTAGAVSTSAAIVIGEYTSPKYRGFFLNLKTGGIYTGSTIVHILGNYFHWKTIAIIALVPHIISFTIAYTWPESPAWLVWKKQIEKSEKSFFWLRGVNDDSKWEYQELVKAQTERVKFKANATILETIMELMRKFTRKDFLKPLFIISTSFILFEACGRHVFPTYALQFIGAIVGSKTEPYFYTLCIDIIITASAISSSVLVRILNRRTLLFSTGFSAVFVLSLACAYLFLVSRNILSNDRHWIAIILFVTYFILANLGCTPIPLALQGELFPLAHRAFGSAISGSILSIFLMIILQITPYLLEEVKIYGTFLVYAAVMFLSLITLYIILPETKDRTLQEIENYFQNGRFQNDTITYDEEECISMINVNKK